MSTTIGEARAVRAETQHTIAPRILRRWPESSPSRSVRRPVEVVAQEIQIQSRPLSQRFAKRSLDVVGSVVGLVGLSPVFVAVALLVRATSRGPAFFVQERCGLGGRVFRFCKFRTMVEDAEAQKADLEHLNEMSGPVFKIARDPRITKLGAFLRKTSIDELPQLWNVLKGEMSLVGPRPPTREEVERYNATQAQRLSVRPGLTGLWQVSGRSAIPDFDHWIKLDLEYARTQSFALDVWILMKTVVVVLSTRGAL